MGQELSLDENGNRMIKKNWETGMGTFIKTDDEHRDKQTARQTYNINYT